MFRIDVEMQLQLLPEGYEIVTEGNLKEGDIRWNRWLEEWNLNDITQSPKHDIVIGDPIKSFGGVCRKLKINSNLSKNEKLLEICSI